MAQRVKRRRGRKAGPSMKLPTMIELLMKGRQMRAADIVIKLEGLGWLKCANHRANRSAVLTTLRRSDRFRKVDRGLYRLGPKVKWED